ncbi:MAG: hypothetical protein B6I36_10030 [Desulfobacteraceae bacterium 4572_35.1]|nr:MAG: hypothetical protein B6I36_10030 [Desulfobacteraceae bacterium 4572_35.1]
MEIQKLKDVVRGSGKYLIYGSSGSGKTHSLSTMPVEKTLIINAEHGLRTLDDICPDLDVANIDSLDDLRDVVGMLEPYDYIGIDSLSTIADLALREAMELSKDGRKAYVAMADKVFGIVETFNKMPQTVIYLAQEGRVNPEEAGLFNYSYCPELPGKKFAARLPYLFDFVWSLRIRQTETKEGLVTERRFQTNMDGTGSYLAKSRSQRFDLFEEVNFASIFNKLNKKGN